MAGVLADLCSPLALGNVRKTCSCSVRDLEALASCQADLESIVVLILMTMISCIRKRGLGKKDSDSAVSLAKKERLMGRRSLGKLKLRHWSSRLRRSVGHVAAFLHVDRC